GSKPARIGHTALDSAGGRSQRRCQQRPRSFSLTAFEISIAGADRYFARRNGVAVHRDAHAATGFAPLCAGFLENAVEAFGFGLPLHFVGTRHNEHANCAAYFVPANHTGSTAQIRKPAVRAASYEHYVNWMSGQ